MIQTLTEAGADRYVRGRKMWTTFAPQERQFNVYVAEDDGVFVVAKSDVPGLHLEADTLAELIEEIEAWAPDLLIENGVIPALLPFRVLIHRSGAQQLTVRP